MPSNMTYMMSGNEDEEEADDGVVPDMGINPEEDTFAQFNEDMMMESEGGYGPSKAVVEKLVMEVNDQNSFFQEAGGPPSTYY